MHFRQAPFWNGHQIIARVHRENTVLQHIGVFLDSCSRHSRSMPCLLHSCVGVERVSLLSALQLDRKPRSSVPPRSWEEVGRMTLVFDWRTRDLVACTVLFDQRTHFGFDILWMASLWFFFFGTVSKSGIRDVMSLLGKEWRGLAANPLRKQLWGSLKLQG